MQLFNYLVIPFFYTLFLLQAPKWLYLRKIESTPLEACLCYSLIHRAVGNFTTFISRKQLSWKGSQFALWIICGVLRTLFLELKIIYFLYCNWTETIGVINKMNTDPWYIFSRWTIETWSLWAQHLLLILFWFYRLLVFKPSARIAMLPLFSAHLYSWGMFKAQNPWSVDDLEKVKKRGVGWKRGRKERELGGVTGLVACLPAHHPLR